MRIKNIFLIITIIISIFSVSNLFGADKYIINIDAIPATIEADGKSYSQIAVDIKSIDNLPVPDGTEIKFVATSGIITAAAYTGNGKATAILTSTPTPALAIVTASIGDSSASTQVEFASNAYTKQTIPDNIRIEGGSLAYSVERDTILAANNAELSIRNLKIRASNIQINLRSSLIKAQGNVVVSNNNANIGADTLVYDYTLNNIKIMNSGIAPSVVSFNAIDLKMSDLVIIDSSSTKEFLPLEAENTKTWIISKKATIAPNDKIRFFRASVYLNELHVLDMPHYFFDYNNRGTLLSQIKYTSTDGLVIDYPVYYSVTDNNSGSIKLRYSENQYGYGNYLNPSKGLSLSIDQTYSIGNKGEGRLFIDSITDDNRSIEVIHRQDYGTIIHPGRADFSFRYQPSSKFGKKVYTAGINMFGDSDKYTYYLSGFLGGSEYQYRNFLNPEEIEYRKQVNTSVRLSINPKKRYMISKSFTLYPHFSLNYGNPIFTDDWNRGECLYQTTGMNYSSKIYNNKFVNISFDGSSEYAISSDGRSGFGIRNSINGRKNWQNGSLSIGYTNAIITGDIGTMYYPSKHNLNGTVLLNNKQKWNLYSFWGYGLDTGRMNVFSNLNYRFNSVWQLRANYSYYKYKYKTDISKISSTVDYMKAGVYRSLGPYEIGLAWSPDGEIYGYRDGKKLWLEVGFRGI